MKRIAFILSMVAMTFAACSDDDAFEDISHATIAESIVGKWHHTGSDVAGTYTATTSPCATALSYQEFAAGGAARYVMYDTECDFMETYNGSWTLDGTEITFPSFSTVTFNIESLTSQNLILKNTLHFEAGDITTIAYYTRIE